VLSRLAPSDGAHIAVAANTSRAVTRVEIVLATGAVVDVTSPTKRVNATVQYYCNRDATTTGHNNGVRTKYARDEVVMQSEPLLHMHRRCQHTVNKSCRRRRCAHASHTLFLLCYLHARTRPGLWHAFVKWPTCPDVCRWLQCATCTKSTMCVRRSCTPTKS
jgi:hypothetical protein